MTAFFGIAFSELAIYVGAAWWFRQEYSTSSTDEMSRTHRGWHAVFGVDTVTTTPKKNLP
ncbi:hypothetical protein [Nocardia sp. NPDC059239]|uniref:hypothetical protein n=1 Tax=Nocardia sp. NPDC059239 TaxID=3346785 RepID=UPI0036BAF1C0